MHGEVGDRLVLHGQGGTRIGVIVEHEEGGSRVRWADGGESVLSPATEAPEHSGHATWEAAKASPAVSWRRGITAGVGHEAALRQQKLVEEAKAAEAKAEAKAAEAPAEAKTAEEPAEHKPAAGE
jgi:hypothetical protein